MDKFLSRSPKLVIKTKMHVWFRKITFCSLLPKGRRKCIQHFIQHRKFSMLDEVLDAFESFQNLEKYKKKKIIWSLLSIKLFIQHFLFHPTIFSWRMHLSSFSFIILSFNTALSAKHLQWSVFPTFECFFHNQNTKKSIFKHRQLQARQGKKRTELTTWQVAAMMKLTQWK